MAENVKRRVAAARMAVAFVAATTIAGATAWAQAGPPPTADSSALNADLKLKVDSGDIKNGSLLYQDFKAGEVVAGDIFHKYKQSIADFKQDVKVDSRTLKSELGDVKLELGTFVKSSDADARYLKVNDPVVRGDGSVFSESKLITVVPGRVPLMDVPGLVSVEAENGKPRFVYVTNQTAGPLTHTRCGEGAFETGAGVVDPGKSFHCPATDVPATIQLFGQGANPTIVTMTVSAIGNLGEDGQYTVQVLVGS